mmetsp:Transcript_71188/g.231275  ORF Transcript_71188/g.231275 Transcript_71188/m.231275 type:complete len:270 (-) Transcript_71188:668-1477(-)
MVGSEVARRVGQVPSLRVAGELRVKQPGGPLNPSFASRSIRHAVPKVHVHTVVSLVVVLPTTLGDKLREAVDTLKLVDGDLSRSLVAVGAIAPTCRVCTSTARLGQRTLRGVLAELPAAALSRQAVPSGVVVKYLAGPLRRRKLVGLVAAHRIANFLEGFLAIKGAGALSQVEGEPDSEIHARVDERLRRLGREFESLHACFLEATLIAVVDNFMMQIPHGARQVRNILIFGRIVGIALHAVHIKGLGLSSAGPQQRRFRRSVTLRRAG